MNLKSISLLFLLVSTSLYTQERVYVVVDGITDRNDVKVFKVNEQNVTSQKYENREVDNPEYLEIVKKIENREKEIANLKGKKYSDKQKEHLLNARSYLKKGLNYKSGELDIFGNKWKDIRSAKKELDNSGLEFQQTIKRKYSVALEDAQKNINLIEDYLGLSVEKSNQISKLNREVSSLKSKAGIGFSGSGYKKVPKKIRKDVPIGEINRTVLIVANENVANDLRGKFIDVGNGYDSSPNYYLMNQDFKQFVKNELVPRLIISKFSTDSKRNEVTDGVSSYSFRYNDKKSYLFKDVETGQIYYTNSNAISQIMVEESKMAMYNVMKANNIKIEEEGRKTYISKNGKKIVLTEEVQAELAKGNANIISEMNSSIEKYRAVLKKAMAKTETIANHIKSYRSRTMTKSRLKTWEKDTNKLIALEKQINRIPYTNTKTFNKQLKRQEVQVHSAILDFIRESKYILGI